MNCFPRRFVLSCLFVAVLAGCGGGSQNNANVSAVPPMQSDTAIAPASGAASTTDAAVATATTATTTGAPLQLFQVFDFYMSAAQATATAKQVTGVWGAGTGSRGATARTWTASNPGILDILYFYQGLDTPYISGHNLAWFQANHPDWIVYDCDTSNRPTHTVAYQPGLPGVPLDIHNPSVVNYQIDTAAKSALARGHNAIGSDQTVFFDYDGRQSPGYFGCGVYLGRNYTNFVRRWGFTGPGFPNYDPQWKTDVANWVKLAHNRLVTTYANRVKLAVNHPGGNPSDTAEQTLVANADVVLNETGFSDYGRFPTIRIIDRTLAYMNYVQSKGKTYYTIEKMGSAGGTSATAGVTSSQLSWAISTFLLGNQGHAAMYVTSGPYGVPSYFSQYTTVNSKMGKACGPAIKVGTAYTRRYTGGFVVANDGGTLTQSVPLPTGHSYADLMARSLGNPLHVVAGGSYVLFTATNGCL
jgi:hypothetical protein